MSDFYILVRIASSKRWCSLPVYEGSLTRSHYPKSRDMIHALSLSVIIAFIGTYFYISFAITAAGVVLRDQFEYSENSKIRFINA